jgi:hypothetical protein
MVEYNDPAGGFDRSGLDIELEWFLAAVTRDSQPIGAK